MKYTYATMVKQDPALARIVEGTAGTIAGSRFQELSKVSEDGNSSQYEHIRACLIAQVYTVLYRIRSISYGEFEDAVLAAAEELAVGAQYETAQALLLALNNKLVTDDLTDAEWSQFSHEYAVLRAKVAKLHKAWLHECSKAAYAKAVAA